PFAAWRRTPTGPPRRNCPGFRGQRPNDSPGQSRLRETTAVLSRLRSPCAHSEFLRYVSQKHAAKTRRNAALCRAVRKLRWSSGSKIPLSCRHLVFQASEFEDCFAADRLILQKVNPHPFR